MWGLIRIAVFLFFYGIAVVHAKVCEVIPKGLPFERVRSEKSVSFFYTKEEILGVVKKVEGCAAERESLNKQLGRLKGLYHDIRAIDTTSVLAKIATLRKNLAILSGEIQRQVNRFSIPALYAVALDVDKADTGDLQRLVLFLLSAQIPREREKSGLNVYVPDGVRGGGVLRIRREIFRVSDNYEGRYQFVGVYLCDVYLYAQGRRSWNENGNGIVADLVSPDGVDRVRAFMENRLSPYALNSMLSSLSGYVSLWRESVLRERRKAIAEFKRKIFPLFEQLRRMKADLQKYGDILSARRNRLVSIYKSIGFICSNPFPERCRAKAEGVLSTRISEMEKKISELVMSIPHYSISDNMETAYRDAVVKLEKKGFSVSRVWVYPFKDAVGVKYLVLTFPGSRRR